MFIKCSSLTHCVACLSSKADMLQFLEDRAHRLGSELSKLERQPSLFSYLRVKEIKAELEFIYDLQKELSHAQESTRE